MIQSSQEDVAGLGDGLVVPGTERVLVFLGRLAFGDGWLSGAGGSGGWLSLAGNLRYRHNATGLFGRWRWGERTVVSS